jgi:ATP-dependent DNA helicase DinG
VVEVHGDAMTDDPAPDAAATDRVAATLHAVVERLPGGGERHGQQSMADAVAAAFAVREHLLVQAGTGTGKSLAYLVPAVLADERVVVVTATRALQEQLCGKDLPFLHQVMVDLGHSFSYAQLKGRSNYLCRARLAEHATDRAGVLTGIRADDAQLEAIDAWAERTATGDRGDFDEPIPDSLWDTLSMDSRECPGRTKCSHGEDCFAERARDTAAAADIVVVNTALYAQHLAAGGAVLPDHGLVVIDEAHMLEDVCAGAFGVELGPRRLERLAAEIRTFLTGEGGGDADAVIALGERARRWDELLRGCPNEQRVDLDGAGLRAALLALNESLASVRESITKVTPAPGDAALKQQRVLRLVESTRDDVHYMLGATPERDAIWVERRDPPILLVARIDVGPPLATSLFRRAATVLTSATLALGHDFDPLAWRLGLRPELLTGNGDDADDADDADGDDTDSGSRDVTDGDLGATEADEGGPRRPSHPERFRSLDVGSPFDYRSQAILYCAAHLPDPRKEQFATAWLDEAVALVRAAGGRTLGLCTSLRAAGDLREVLREQLPDVRVLAPDDLPRARLMAEFAADETSCLIGSLGLWQGLDVPGPSVSLVRVDKIPFARPNDPLAVARREQAESEGRDPFRTFDLPRAALLLAQGVGRLVRSHDDRGVVAVLDRRLVTSGYGRTLIESLPPMFRMTDPVRVQAALERLAASSSA